MNNSFENFEFIQPINFFMIGIFFILEIFFSIFYFLKIFGKILKKKFNKKKIPKNFSKKIISNFFKNFFFNIKKLYSNLILLIIIQEFPKINKIFLCKNLLFSKFSEIFYIIKKFIFIFLGTKWIIKYFKYIFSKKKNKIFQILKSNFFLKEDKILNGIIFFDLLYYIFRNFLIKIFQNYFQFLGILLIFFSFCYISICFYILKKIKKNFRIIFFFLIFSEILLFIYFLNFFKIFENFEFFNNFLYCFINFVKIFEKFVTFKIVFKCNSQFYNHIKNAKKIAKNKKFSKNKLNFLNNKIKKKNHINNFLNEKIQNLEISTQKNLREKKKASLKINLSEITKK